MTKEKILKYLPLVVLVGLSIAAYFLDVQHYFNFEYLRSHQQVIEQYIVSNYAISILIYMLTYIIVVALSIPGATFMTLLGGFLFGQWVGTGTTVVAATIGAFFVFLSAKMASSDLLSKRAGEFASRMQAGFQKDALSYLITLRLIPLFPFVAVNLAAALFQIPIRTFIIGTFFGIIPGSFVYIAMGVALREVITKPDISANLILDPKILLAFIGLGILFLLPILYKKLKK